MFTDLKFALRQLRKSPGFTLTAIATLALAIGANAVVFGVMDALVLHTLPVPDAKTLYGTVYGANPGFQAYPNYLDLRQRNHSFQDLAAFNFAFTGFDKGNNPELASGFAVTANYFDVLGLHPYLGRFFSPADERGAGSAPYLVLSYAYWHSHFQDDRSVIGRVVEINKHPFTIVGVAPPGFGGTLMFVSIDFFVPIVNQQQVGGPALDSRSTGAIFEIFGHLKPGVTVAQAQADCTAVGAYLAKTYPKDFAQNEVALDRTGLTAFGGGVRAFVTALMALAGLILLAACANLGSLFAAHAADRGKEVALRIALGSPRNRILRQLLTEAVMISLAGGALGLVGAMALLRQVSNWNPFAGAPIHIPVTMDARIYVVALALALVSGVLFGIVPVRQMMRANAYQVMKAGAGTAPGRKVSARDVLLAVQIAICAVLITSSLVAVHGLVRSLKSNYGFEPRGALVGALNLSAAGYNGEQTLAMQRRIMDAMTTIPGVEAAGVVNNWPPLVYTGAFRTAVFKEQSNDFRTSNIAISPFHFDVTPGYLKAAKTSLLAGRDFSWADDKNAPPVALVNRQFALKMFGSVNGALGRHFKLQGGTSVQVVGIVEDGKYQALTEDAEPAFFMPPQLLSTPGPGADVIVRSARDPEQLAAAMRSKIHEIDPGLPVDIQSYNSLLGVVLFPARVATMALSVLGFMGAMLSITGIFGMAAYSVSRRLKELGIRIALGARRTEVLKSALDRAVKLLAIGSVAGLILGVLASKVLASIVYQATPRDPLVLGGVVLAMALLGVVATWIPAQRALSVDPLVLLRDE